MSSNPDVHPLRVAVAFAAAAALAFSAGAAAAGTLVAGGNSLAGTTTALEPQLAGTVVEDVDTPVSFALGGGTFNATVQSRVVLSVDGTYDFYWRIHDTSFAGGANNPLIAPGAAPAIGAFRLGDFGIPIAGLNGDYATDGLGDVGPDGAFVFSSPFDQDVNFNFSGGLAAGQDSYFMFLDTNAHHYAMNATFDLAGPGFLENSAIFPTFGVAGVPEPAEWSLMIAGFGLAGAMLRSRRKPTLA